MSLSCQFSSLARYRNTSMCYDIKKATIITRYGKQVKHMKCQFCGRGLPDGKTGKRPRQYCNDACKQASYRQRHRAGGTSLQRELDQARLRISELERLVR